MVEQSVNLRMKIGTLFFFLLLSLSGISQDTLSEYIVDIRGPLSAKQYVENTEVQISSKQGKVFKLVQDQEVKTYRFLGEKIPFGVYTCSFKNANLNDSVVVLIDKYSKQVMIRVQEDGKWFATGIGYNMITTNIEVFGLKKDTLRNAIIEVRHLELNSKTTFKAGEKTSIPDGISEVSIRLDNKVYFQDTLNFIENPYNFKVFLSQNDCIYIREGNYIHPITLMKDSYIAYVSYKEPDQLKSLLTLCNSFNLKAPTYSQMVKNKDIPIYGSTGYEFLIKANSQYSAFDSKSLEGIRSKGYSCGPLVIDQTREEMNRGRVSNTLRVVFINGYAPRNLEDFCKKYGLKFEEKEQYQIPRGYDIPNSYKLIVPEGTGWGIFEIAKALNDMTQYIEYAYPNIAWYTHEIEQPHRMH